MDVVKLSVAVLVAVLGVACASTSEGVPKAADGNGDEPAPSGEASAAAPAEGSTADGGTGHEPGSGTAVADAAAEASILDIPEVTPRQAGIDALKAYCQQLYSCHRAPSVRDCLAAGTNIGMLRECTVEQSQSCINALVALPCYGADGKVPAFPTVCRSCIDPSA